MFIKQFFVDGLGHASYMIGSDLTKEAAVVDPRRDVDVYIREAQQQGLTLRYALETHNHNDFVSGAQELSRRMGAIHVASAESGLRFPHRRVTEGDEIQIGELRVMVLSTPGHTPEHITYVVIDSSRADVPVLAFTGGDLLVGTVGRPDLLGRELGEKLAPMLFDSLHDKILKLEDYVEVLPTHGAGSLCGKEIGSKLTSTIGYERRFNQALQIADRDEFVRHVLSGNPGIPTCYRRMRPTNQEGPDPWALPDPIAVPPGEVHHMVGHGAVVVDTRPSASFGAGHIPGALNVGLEGGFSTWVGWLLSPEIPMILVLEDEADWAEAVTQLARVGFENVVGYLRGGMEGWILQGLPIARLSQWDVHTLKLRLDAGAATVLDVRTEAEVETGRIPGAIHVRLDQLPEQAERLAGMGPLAVVCGGGFRSSIAASLLAGRGHGEVASVAGGMDAWKGAGYLTDKEPEELEALPAAA